MYSKLIAITSFIILVAQPDLIAQAEDEKPSIALCGKDYCAYHSAVTDSLATSDMMHASTSSQMGYFLSNLFSTTNWPARWNCGTWTTFHGWFYIISDVGIWAAYFAIPVVLAFFLYRRRTRGLPFTGIFILFIAFIFSCGLTHLTDAIIFWEPIYNFSALMRFITAVVSIGTVFALVKVTPKVMEYKSPEELEALVMERTQELKVANSQLQHTNDELARVNRELEDVNGELARQYSEKENARQELNLLIESIPQIAWTTNKNGELTYVNNNWWNYTGLTKENYIPDWSLAFHDDDIKELSEKWKKSIEKEEEFVSEGRLKSASGDYRWFLMKAVPIKDVDGNLIRWTGTFTDIHDQKVVEHRKDSFLNIASHELKTPLSIIMAYLEMLENGIVIDDTGKKYVEKISKQSSKLNGLINELLDVSRIDSGKMNFDLSEFNFDEMVEECLSDFRSLSKGRKLNVDLNTNLTITADRSKIQQVLQNLLSNADKYSPENESIYIRTKEENGKVHCSIMDKGIGIPKDDQKLIFSRFYRSGNPSKTVGLGLGLYISKEIIEHHDGQIKLESSHDSGSNFTIELPITKLSEDA